MIKRALILFLVLITTAFSGTLNLCSSCQVMNSMTIEKDARSETKFECPYHKKNQTEEEKSENDSQTADVCLKCLLSFGEIKSIQVTFSYELIGTQGFIQKSNYFSFYLESGTPPPIYS